jgi:hypothetical protein
LGWGGIGERFNALDAERLDDRFQSKIKGKIRRLIRPGIVETKFWIRRLGRFWVETARYGPAKRSGLRLNLRQRRSMAHKVRDVAPHEQAYPGLKAWAMISSRFTASPTTRSFSTVCLVGYGCRHRTQLWHSWLLLCLSFDRRLDRQCRTHGLGRL